MGRLQPPSNDVELSGRPRRYRRRPDLLGLEVSRQYLIKHGVQSGNERCTRIQVYFAAQWLAYTLPYRRFADTLTDACARLGADADRYSFIAVDLHHLLLADLPAHLLKNSVLRNDLR